MAADIGALRIIAVFSDRAGFIFGNYDKNRVLIDGLRSDSSGLKILNNAGQVIGAISSINLVTSLVSNGLFVSITLNKTLNDGMSVGNLLSIAGHVVADLDINHDGKMDTTDDAFSNLRVWKDANSNGPVDAGELLTLAQAGVKSLNTGFTSPSVTDTDANANQHLQARTFTTDSFQCAFMAFRICGAPKTRTRKVATKLIADYERWSSAKCQFFAKQRVDGQRKLTRSADGVSAASRNLRLAFEAWAA